MNYETNQLEWVKSNKGMEVSDNASPSFRSVIGDVSADELEVQIIMKTKDSGTLSYWTPIWRAFNMYWGA